MYTASKVIELAKKEVGYLEKRSNSQLDSKTNHTRMDEDDLEQYLQEE